MRFLVLVVLFFQIQVTSAEPEGTIPAAAPTSTVVSEDMVLIINADNPARSISESDVRDYFFKRKRHWPDGTVVRFIDRTNEVPARKVFLKNIIKKSSEDVDLYWIGQKVYSGDSAPLREASDATTIEFVASFKGGIGYLSNAAALNGKSVKILKIESK